MVVVQFQGNTEDTHLIAKKMEVQKKDKRLDVRIRGNHRDSADPLLIPHRTTSLKKEKKKGNTCCVQRWLEHKELQDWKINPLY